MERLTVYDWLAIFGALAWLPPIISYVYKLLTKPKLTIIIHKQIELGYTSNGSILNLSIALSTENTECLVKNIEIEMEGPNKQQHTLKWEWFEEKLYEFEYPELGPTPVRKQQNAIAIKILKESLVEKKVGFHEIIFKTEYLKHYNLTTEHYFNITQSDQDVTTIKSAKSYNDFKSFLLNSSMWKEGNYKGLIKVYVLNIKEPFTKSFDFKLTAIDVKRLKQNIDTCGEVLENHYITNDDEYSASWNWVYPNTIEK